MREEHTSQLNFHFRLDRGVLSEQNQEVNVEPIANAVGRLKMDATTSAMKIVVLKMSRKENSVYEEGFSPMKWA